MLLVKAKILLYDFNKLFVKLRPVCVVVMIVVMAFIILLVESTVVLATKIRVKTISYTHPLVRLLIFILNIYLTAINNSLR